LRLVARKSSFSPRAQAALTAPRDIPARRRQPEEAAMSDTNSYKTVTFRTQDEFCSVIVALESYIASLDRIAEGDYRDWPNGERMRANAVAAKNRMESAE
jgi:hypothetical protein